MMKITQSIRARQIFGIIAALFVLTCVTAIAKNAQAEAEIAQAGKHVLTIYDGGEERGYLTEADTLKAALDEAGVKLNENDVTEPALDEKLVAGSYNVNIYRARSVTVIDGNTRTKVMSPYRTAKQVAKQAGIELQTEDKAVLTSSADDFVATGAMETMEIDRATPVTLIYYGKKTTVYTHEVTVADLLKSKDIEVGKTDTLSVKKDAKITKNMTIELWRNGSQTVTEDKEVDFPVEQIQDANRDAGYREVKSAGKKGMKTVTYEIVMKNGKEVSRKEIGSVVTKEPVKQVEIVGTKPVIAKYTGGGSKDEWLTRAGIARSHWAAADYIVSQESGWNPNAVNASSGACGLAQALPCSKVPGNPLNPVDSLRWMNGYVNGRYGGWEGAVAFKQANGWY